MGAALALAQRGVGRTAPNPSVGCIVVRDGHVIGRGWTQPGGRPHAEAVALAGAAAGATVYVTLEPCAHASSRGPDCTGLLIDAQPARVVVAIIDPDCRTNGQGIARLRGAGIEVTTGVREAEARAVNAGFFSRQERGRPFVTLKLALSLDGCLALGDGTSRWITGPEARAHAHLERARSDLIVVGRGTVEADSPTLDVRLPGLEDRSPRVAVLGSGTGMLRAFAGIDAMPDVLAVLVEGGAGVAASLLNADRIDRLLIYRAHILLGGKPGIGDLGLTDLGAAHGRWRRTALRPLGVDVLEVYERTR